MEFGDRDCGDKGGETKLIGIREEKRKGFGDLVTSMWKDEQVDSQRDSVGRQTWG